MLIQNQGIDTMNESDVVERLARTQAKLVFETGEMQVQLGELGEAVNSFNRAISFDPDNTDYLRTAITTANSLGHTEIVSKYTERLEALIPSNQ